MTVIESYIPAKRLRAIWHSEQTFMLGKTDTIRLIQINMLDEGQRLLNAVGSVCDETAKLDVLQIVCRQR